MPIPSLNRPFPRAVARPASHIPSGRAHRSAFVGGSFRAAAGATGSCSDSDHAGGYLTGQGPWSLGCISCCLSLTRLELELVADAEHKLHDHPEQSKPPVEGPTQPHLQVWGEESKLHVKQYPYQQQKRQWRQVEGLQQQQPQSDPAQLAAGQAALLEGLSRLTRLTHLSIRLLDLPVGGGVAVDSDVRSELDSMEGSDEEGIGGFIDSRKQVQSTAADATGRPYVAGGYVVAPIAPLAPSRRGPTAPAPAAMSAAGPEPDFCPEDYVLDVEEAGNYDSDLEVDLLDLGQDRQVELHRQHSRMAWETEGTESVVVGWQAADDSARCLQRYQHFYGTAADEAGASPLAVQPGEVGLPSAKDSAADVADVDSSHGSSYKGSQDGSSSRSGEAATGAGATHRSAAAYASVSLHWNPQPALFTRMGPRLRCLQLSGCDLRGGGALAALAMSLTALTSLQLQGRLGVSHEDMAALSSLKDLRVCGQEGDMAWW